MKVFAFQHTMFHKTCYVVTAVIIGQGREHTDPDKPEMNGHRFSSNLLVDRDGVPTIIWCPKPGVYLDGGGC